MRNYTAAILYKSYKYFLLVLVVDNASLYIAVFEKNRILRYTLLRNKKQQYDELY